VSDELPAPLYLSQVDFAQRVRLSPLVAVDIIIRNRQGEALLAKRNDEPACGFLFTPGGCILKNEPIETAFERIAERETGCRLSFASSRLLGVYQHFYRATRYGDDTSGTHYVALGYETALPDDAPIHLDRTHSSYRWLSNADILASAEVHDYAKDYFRPGRRTPHVAI
jgi:colanic acid biosynthesis protein WcaH